MIAELNKPISICALQKILNTVAHFEVEFDHYVAISYTGYNMLVKI